MLHTNTWVACLQRNHQATTMLDLRYPMVQASNACHTGPTTLKTLQNRQVSITHRLRLFPSAVSFALWCGRLRPTRTVYKTPNNFQFTPQKGTGYFVPAITLIGQSRGNLSHERNTRGMHATNPYQRSCKRMVAFWSICCTVYLKTASGSLVDSRWNNVGWQLQLQCFGWWGGVALDEDPAVSRRKM